MAFSGSALAQLIVRWDWKSSLCASLMLAAKGRDMLVRIGLEPSCCHFGLRSSGNIRPNRHRTAKVRSLSPISSFLHILQWSKSKVCD